MNESSNLPELDIDPYSAENLIDPYPMHERIREAGPAVRLTAYPSVVACGRHEQVHAVFNNHDTFISGAGVGLSNFNLETPFRPKSLILEADPPLHTQTRTVLSRILSPKAVMQIRATFTAVAEQMVDRCVQKSVAEGSICGIHDLAQIYPLKVFPDAVGLEGDGRENLLIYGDLIFNSMGPRNDLLAKAAQRMGPVTDWIMTHCQREHLRPNGFGDQIYRPPTPVRSAMNRHRCWCARSSRPGWTPPSTASATHSLRWLTTPSNTLSCMPMPRWPARHSKKHCVGSQRPRPSFAPLHATAKSPVCRSLPTPKCCAYWPRPIATRANGPSPIDTISSGDPAAMWPWGQASTVAWGRPWPDWKARWC
jgi:hypothetical protein